MQSTSGSGSESSSLARVLYVDDDACMRELLVDVFEEMQVSGHVVASGEAALELLESRELSFHLLITDHQMPGMLGTELAARVLERLPAMPVVLVTAYRDQVVEQASAGVFRVLDKPVSFTVLQRTVAEALAHIK